MEWACLYCDTLYRIVARVREADHHPQPDSDTGHFPFRVRKPQEVKDVALGTWVFYRRANRGFTGIYGHFCGCGGHRQDPVLSVSNSFPGHIDGSPAAQVMT